MAQRGSDAIGAEHHGLGLSLILAPAEPATMPRKYLSRHVSPSYDSGYELRSTGLMSIPKYFCDSFLIVPLATSFSMIKLGFELGIAFL